ncbi:chromo domain protein [Gregarina niphandrodes]|uniref:Chromo domain protein n=1 Tax=Gregarina niphandrodes TaxID=110365 RepID=A0A023BAG2_GRENI|nr:chromo domain protein [Gregarina niphandrodes]EZG78288.1 chromo domain protein [Gregarina niphandrodes]|eukprot:XP_011129357.1 chromo domain protein [Gregarina niphandrodes]
MAGKRSKAPAPVEVEEDVYDIEQIVDYTEDPKPLWRIRWKGYSASDDTWEPAENIITDDKNIHTEMQKHQAQYRKKKSKGKSSAAPPSRKSAAKETAKPSPRHVTKSPAKATRQVTRDSPPVKSRAVAPPAAAERSSQKNTPGDYEAIVMFDDGNRIRMPAKEARQKYPDELFDYLLHRVRFMNVDYVRKISTDHYSES